MKLKMAITNLIISVLLAAALLGFPPGASQAAVPQYITISDVRDVSFVVSWTTATESNGVVNWGTSTPPANTATDTVASTTSHWVRVSGLTPNTTYYFSVTSDEDTDNNGGAYYTVTTGPSILSAPGFFYWGYVYQANGVTIVPNAIVYLQIQDAGGGGSSGSSQWVSARSNTLGIWSFNLSNLRTSDLLSPFNYQAGIDQLKIIGQGGARGTVGYNPAWVVTIPGGFLAQQNVVLSNGATDVGISSFTGSAQGVPGWAFGMAGAGVLGAAVLGRKRMLRRRAG